MDLYRRAVGVATDPKQTRWLSPLLLAADAALCALIIWKIPCKQTPQASKAPIEAAMNFRVRMYAADKQRCRHRNRLESLHAANHSVSKRRKGLHAH